MDYKEKYEMALEGIQEILSSGEDSIKMSRLQLRLQGIFPELKESSDEQIRKRIIQALHGDVLEMEEISKCTAWLEKQDKQKPINKVEHKFEMGDWVVFNNKHQSIYQVEKIEDGYYILRHTHGGIFRVCVLHDESLRLWTIQDAKDGDVLCTYECGKPKIVFILKGTPKKHYALSYYCYYNIMYPHFGSDSEKGCLAPNDEDVKPATKEQRDLLLTKIRETGYEWNADTKELKKIEQSELTEFEEAVKDMMDDYRDAIDEHAATTEEVKKRAAYMLSLIPHKSAWSEEDNPYYDDICEILINLLHSERTDINKVAIQKDLDWLWHIKQRSLNDVAKEVTKNKETAMSFLKSCGIMNANGELADEYKIKQGEQKPAEWSEEDEKNLQGIMDEIQANKSSAPSYDINVYDRYLSWLKSLKQRIKQ